MVSTSAAVMVASKIHQSSSGTFSIVRICIQSLTKLLTSTPYGTRQVQLWLFFHSFEKVFVSRA